MFDVAYGSLLLGKWEYVIHVSPGMSYALRRKHRTGMMACKWNFLFAYILVLTYILNIYIIKIAAFAHRCIIIQQ